MEFLIFYRKNKNVLWLFALQKLLECLIICWWENFIDPIRHRKRSKKFWFKLKIDDF